MRLRVRMCEVEVEGDPSALVELLRGAGVGRPVELPEPRYLPVYEYIKSKGFPYEHSVDEVRERFADLIRRVSEATGRPEIKVVHDLLTAAHRRLEREEGVKFRSRHVPTPDGLKTVYRAEERGGRSWR